MNINAINHNNAIQGYLNNVKNKPGMSPVKAEAGDSVELSEGAKKYAAFLKSAKDSMDNAEKTEEAKVADIMAQMNNNSYKVPTGDVVGSIMSRFPDYI